MRVDVKGWAASATVLVLIVLILSSIHTVALAASPSYSFQKIADNAGRYDTFPHGAAINDHGAVLFTARFDNGGGGYFSGPDPLLDAAFNPSGYGGIGARRADFNNAGTVVFSGSRSGVGTGVFTFDPDATRADASGLYSDFFTPVINNVGDIAFFALLDAPPGQTNYGVFRGPDPATDAVGTGSLPTFGTYVTFDDPDINDAGTIVFRATLPAGGSGIFSGPDPATDTLVDTTGPYSSILGSVSISNAGVVAFRAELDAGGSGIFIGPDPTLHAIATSAGDYDLFRDPDINTRGTVVFEATLDAGGEGIFTGPDSIADRVIATGDSLFDSTVSNVTFLKGLNEVGEIAFAYSLANGERGIAVAQVPEPTGALAVASLLAGALLRRRR